MSILGNYPSKNELLGGLMMNSPPKKGWFTGKSSKISKKTGNKSKHMFLSPKKKRKKTWSLNKILKISKCHHDSPAETALKITSRACDPSRWHAISGWLGLQIRNTGLGICTWPKGRPHEAVNFRHSSWGNCNGKLMETHGTSSTHCFGSLLMGSTCFLYHLSFEWSLQVMSRWSLVRRQPFRTSSQL